MAKYNGKSALKLGLDEQRSGRRNAPSVKRTVVNHGDYTKGRIVLNSKL